MTEPTPLHRVTPALLDVLEVLAGGPGYDPREQWGLEIIRRTGRPAGTVYPLLARLERDRWVVSRWEGDGERPGPRRRYYRLEGGAVDAARHLIARRRRPEPSVRPTGATA